MSLRKMIRLKVTSISPSAPGKKIEKKTFFFSCNFSERCIYLFVLTLLTRFKLVRGSLSLLNLTGAACALDVRRLGAKLQNKFSFKKTK